MRRNNRRRRSTKSVNYEQDGGMDSSTLQPTYSVATAAGTLLTMKNRDEALKDLMEVLKQECLSATMLDGKIQITGAKSLREHLEEDEEIAEILLHLSSPGHSGRGGGGSGGGRYGEKKWRNDIEGKRVRVWHFLLKKASDISIAWMGVSFPNVMGAVAGSVCAMSFTYLDAIFFTALHILMGGLKGAALSLLGSISLTLMAYVAIKAFVTAYILREVPASTHVINVATAVDEEIGNNVKDAWDQIQTREIIPKILDTLGKVTDATADSLADIMLTRIIRNRYIYPDDPQKGLDSEECKGEDKDGDEHKLFDSELQKGLLNSAITHKEPELSAKRNRRNTIFAATDLGKDVFEIIYNTKIDQDERREREEEAAGYASETSKVDYEGEMGSIMNQWTESLPSEHPLVMPPSHPSPMSKPSQRLGRTSSIQKKGLSQKEQKKPSSPSLVPTLSGKKAKEKRAAAQTAAAAAAQEYAAQTAAAAAAQEYAAAQTAAAVPPY